mgnify:CR=1 FL=1
MIPNSNDYYAFFDVDETIIYPKSMFSFLKFYCIKKTLKFNFSVIIKYIYFTFTMKSLAKKNTPREETNKFYYKFYKGYRFSELTKYGHEWFQYLLNKGHFFNEKVLQEIQEHKKNGAKIVLISGSFFPCLDPIAKHVCADRIECTTLEVIHDICTGNILENPVIGQEKANKIKKILLENNTSNNESCFCYGDHISDLPMLKLVGNPRVISNCQQLISYAKEHKWTIMP